MTSSPSPTPSIMRCSLLTVVLVILSLCTTLCASSSSSHSKSFSSSHPYSHLFTYHKVSVAGLPGLAITPAQLLLEEHHTGYLPVDAHSKSRLFYYLVRARHNRTTAPLVVWFNGGPGCASTVALLQEHGPFNLRGKNNESTVSALQHRAPYELLYNEYSWSTHANMLYIDQPIAVGYSVLDSEASHIPTSQGEIARSLHIALSYFLEEHHPEFRHSAISLSGESYAAKYIPSFATYILGQNSCKQRAQEKTDTVSLALTERRRGGGRHSHQREEDEEDEEAELRSHTPHSLTSADPDFRRYAATFRSLNLSVSCDEPTTDLSAPPLHLHSLLIGNGVYSPLLQRFAFRPLALSLGLIDVFQANQYSQLESRCMAALRRAVITETDEQLLLDAEKVCSKMHSLILEMTGHVDTSDLRRYTDAFDKGVFVQYLNDPHVRRVWKVSDDVPQLDSDCNKAVHNALRADTMRGVRGLLPFLLSFLPITVYTGNFDLKDGTWANEVLLDSLWDWDDRSEWFITRRYVWRPLPILHSNAVFKAQKQQFLKSHIDQSSVGDEDVYGYSKSYGNLSFVVVSQAGHMVASSQAVKAADLFYRFTHQMPFYNALNSTDVEMNDANGAKICKLLQCESAGHGKCNVQTAKCQCDEHWSGSTCNIPVHHMTSALLPLSNEKPDTSNTHGTDHTSHTSHTTLASQSHSSRHQSSTHPKRDPHTPLGVFRHHQDLNVQRTDLYYVHVTPERLEQLGLNGSLVIHRHSTFSSTQTIDQVQSSCTFTPHLRLHISLHEHAVPLHNADGTPMTKHERNLGLTSDGHLTLSVNWVSAFHNKSPHNATLFLGSFDTNNLFFGSAGGSDAQWIGPKLLASMASPSNRQRVEVEVSRCDHFAIKVSNDAGAVHAIGYHIEVALTEVGEEDAREDEEEDSEDDSGEEAAVETVHGGGSGRKGRGGNTSSKMGWVWHLLPWVLVGILSVLSCCLCGMWAMSRAAHSVAARARGENAPLLSFSSQS